MDGGFSAMCTWFGIILIGMLFVILGIHLTKFTCITFIKSLRSVEREWYGEEQQPQWSEGFLQEGE